MKHWFKHEADAHRGRSMQELMDQFGHRGPNCYWILVGLCTEKYWQEPTPQHEESTFLFHRRSLIQEMRTTPSMLRKWLRVCAELKLFSYEETSFLSDSSREGGDNLGTPCSQPVDNLRASMKNQIQITMPKYLEILDRDKLFTRKVRVKSASKNKELEEEKESPLPPVGAAEKEPDKKSEPEANPEIDPHDPNQYVLPGVLKPSSEKSAIDLVNEVRLANNTALSKSNEVLKLIGKIKTGTATKRREHEPSR